MQILRVMTTDPETGMEEQVHKRVVRCWQESGGREVYLHADGTYGDIHGRPVRDAETLDVIGDPRQKRAALSWWENVGREKAAKMYGDEKAPARDPDEFAMYYMYEGKRPKGPKAVTYRDAGYEYRPGWWGPAELITLDGTTFERVPDADQPAEEAEKKTAGNPDEF